ncbi:hypothetical protein SEMRO_512_G157660.1 [Seminavis robusta]|uniref:Uncharacterized protein n=1 Tax=Seminavis robusta TaxID=568900 RepID=A0A9N8HIP5_9STRA|nr:hypothetical protein SEMRO_512_G157660.1 [Seminavis robusta]|eukprot:Sro512_g157660.1 n/a (247) ;mRNA; f:36595-37335
METPAKAKRGSSDDEPCTPKRLKIGDVRRNIKLAKLGCEYLYIEKVQNNMELITLEESPGQDGFLNPIREDIDNNGHLSQSHALTTIVTRRISITNENDCLNIRATGKAHEFYPRQFILAWPDKESTKQTRAKKLTDIAAFLNSKEESRSLRRDSPLKKLADKRKDANLRKYIVPKNYDLTPSDEGMLHKLGHFVKPAHVVGLVRSSYEKASGSWYWNFRAFAKTLFDSPYPTIAQAELGYPEEED